MSSHSSSRPLHGFFLNLQLLCIYLKATGAVQTNWFVLLLPFFVGYGGLIILEAVREAVKEIKAREQFLKLEAEIQQYERSVREERKTPVVKHDKSTVN